jgi:molybdenum cofactor guanylyltransferase
MTDRPEGGAAPAPVPGAPPGYLGQDEGAGVVGVILAGGRATRMGGGDKGLLPLAGRRLIDHVIERLGEQVAGLALNANGDPSRFAEFGLPVLPDSLPDWPGPLAGVLAGLDWAAAEGADAIVTAAADTPFLPGDLVARLRAAAGPSGLSLAASPDETGRVQRHPTFGLWPVALRDDLRGALTGGLRKIVLWTDGHGAGSAVFPSDPFDPFFNVNTPDDLTLAEGLAR